MYCNPRAGDDAEHHPCQAAKLRLTAKRQLNTGKDPAIEDLQPSLLPYPERRSLVGHGKIDSLPSQQPLQLGRVELLSHTGRTKHPKIHWLELRFRHLYRFLPASAEFLQQTPPGWQPRAHCGF